jgi:hypothetical protein
MEVVPPWSATIITDKIIATASESFNCQAIVIARDVRFVNFICDTGTVLHIKIVHSGLANATAISDILPPNVQANDDWNAEQYEFSFARA